MNKKDLRDIFVQKRKELSPEKVQSKSQQLADMFRDRFNLGNIHVVHVFLPILHRNEIDTSYLIKEIRKHSHIQVAVPKVNEFSGELETYLLKEDTKLVTTRWGIPEPENASLLNEEKIDLILMPLLAFDKEGQRVGYGKGFYDRLLKRCRPDVIKVGLSFFDPIEEISDTESYDVKMNYCLTPERMFVF